MKFNLKKAEGIKDEFTKLIGILIFRLPAIFTRENLYECTQLPWFPVSATHWKCLCVLSKY